MWCNKVKNMLLSQLKTKWASFFEIKLLILTLSRCKVWLNNFLLGILSYNNYNKHVFLFLGEEIYRNLFIKSTCKDGSSSCLKYYKTQSKYKLKVSVICISWEATSKKYMFIHSLLGSNSIFQLYCPSFFYMSPTRLDKPPVPQAEV